MFRFAVRLILALTVWGAVLGHPARAEEEGSVCAVLFYSPTCPHCHDVIQNTLLPLTETYGGTLQILAVDVSNQAGQDLFNAALHRFAVPEERTGVPMLFIGERMLVGSVEIPDQFPALVEAHLSRGGVGCPEIPGLAASMAASSETTSEGTSTTDAAPAESASLPETTAPGIATAMAQDPVGNGLALVVLVAMLISGAWVVALDAVNSFLRVSADPTTGPAAWLSLPVFGCVHRDSARSAGWRKRPTRSGR